MISVVICSKNPPLLDSLKKNIDETIGSKYELIVVDNSANEYSIFTAYNKGQEQSQYPYICFVHEDVYFHTQNWGLAICKHLEDPQCGIIGVSGGALVPRVPSPWSIYTNTQFILQSDKTHSKGVLIKSKGYNSLSYKPVISLDGVFLSARKTLFEKIKFDDKKFEGFHFYDADICVQAHVLGFENRAINNILLEHFSSGNPNREWIENSLIFIKKWKASLPLKLEEISDAHLQKIEYRFMTKIFLKRMVRANYSNKFIVETIQNCLEHDPAIKSNQFRIALLIRLYLTRIIKKPSTLFGTN